MLVFEARIVPEKSSRPTDSFREVKMVAHGVTEQQITRGERITIITGSDHEVERDKFYFFFFIFTLRYERMWTV